MFIYFQNIFQKNIKQFILQLLDIPKNSKTRLYFQNMCITQQYITDIYQITHDIKINTIYKPSMYLTDTECKFWSYSW